MIDLGLFLAGIAIGFGLGFSVKEKPGILFANCTFENCEIETDEQALQEKE